MRHDLDLQEHVAAADPTTLELHERTLRRITQNRMHREWPSGFQRTMLDQFALLDLAHTAYRRELPFESVMDAARSAFCAEYGRPPRALPAALEREAREDALDEWETEESIRIGHVDYSLGEKQARRARVEQLRAELGERFLADTDANKYPMVAGRMVREWQRKMRKRTTK